MDLIDRDEIHLLLCNELRGHELCRDNSDHCIALLQEVKKEMKPFQDNNNYDKLITNRIKSKVKELNNK